MEKVSRTKARFETDDGEEVVIQVGDTVVMNYDNQQLGIPDQTELTISAISTTSGGLMVKLESDFLGSENDPRGERDETHILANPFQLMYQDGSIRLE